MVSGPGASPVLTSTERSGHYCLSLLRFDYINQSFECIGRHCYNEGKIFFRLGETRLLLFSLFEFEYTIRIKAASAASNRINTVHI